MKKRMIAVALVLTMCLGAATTTSAATTATNKTAQTAQTTQFGQEARENGYVVKLTSSNKGILRRLFNAKEYAAMYPDVYKAYGNNEKLLWKHFITYGIYEGRSVNENLNILAYSSAYPDLQMAFENDLMAYYKHYLRFGSKEKRPISTLAEAERAGIEVIGMDGSIVNEKTSDETPATTPAQSTNNNGSNQTVSTPAASTNAGNTNGGNGSSNTTATKPSTPSETPATPSTPSTPDTPSTPTDPTPNTPSIECEHGDYTYEQSPTEGKHYRICGKCGHKEEVACVDGYVQLDNNMHARGCYLCGDIGNHEPTQCSHRGYKYDGDTHIDICACGRVLSTGKCEYETEYLYDELHAQVCQICGQVKDVESCTPVYTFDEEDGYSHTVECSECHNKMRKEACNIKVTSNPDGTHTKTCTVCGHTSTAACEYTGYKYDGIDETTGKAHHARFCGVCGGKGDEEDCEYETVDYGEDMVADICKVCNHIKSIREKDPDSTSDNNTDSEE